MMERSTVLCIDTGNNDVESGNSCSGLSISYHPVQVLVSVESTTRVKCSGLNRHVQRVIPETVPTVL